MFVPGTIFIIIIIFLYLIVPTFLVFVFIIFFTESITNLVKKIEKKILPIKEILILSLMSMFAY